MQEVVTKIEDDEQIVVSVVKKDYHRVPRFMTIVEENKIISQTQVVSNSVEIFKDMSRTAHWLLWNLIAVRIKKTNVAKFTAKDNIEAKKISKAYKELFMFGLIKRIKRQHYLINPNAFIPEFAEYANVIVDWNDIVKDEIAESGDDNE